MSVNVMVKRGVLVFAAVLFCVLVTSEASASWHVMQPPAGFERAELRSVLRPVSSEFVANDVGTSWYLSYTPASEKRAVYKEAYDGDVYERYVLGREGYRVDSIERYEDFTAYNVNGAQRAIVLLSHELDEIGTPHVPVIVMHRLDDSFISLERYLKENGITQVYMLRDEPAGYVRQFELWTGIDVARI